MWCGVGLLAISSIHAFSYSIMSFLRALYNRYIYILRVGHSNKTVDSKKKDFRQCHCHFKKVSCTIVFYVTQTGVNNAFTGTIFGLGLIHICRPYWDGEQK